MHPITKRDPIFTTDVGANIYELVPTDFLNNKTGDFYYANFMLWQQLQVGTQPIEAKAKLTKIVNIANGSGNAQDKVNQMASLAYQILLQESLGINKSLVLECCTQFYYLEHHDPKAYNGDEVKDAIITDPKAYDFFLSRLEPLLAHYLSKSKSDMQAFMTRTEKVLTLLEKELKPQSKISSEI